MIDTKQGVNMEDPSKMSKALFYRSKNHEDRTKDLWYLLTNVEEGGEVIKLHVVYMANVQGQEDMKEVPENND
jgi:hypothetical protein